MPESSSRWETSPTLRLRCKPRQAWLLGGGRPSLGKWERGCHSQGPYHDYGAILKVLVHDGHLFVCLFVHCHAREKHQAIRFLIKSLKSASPSRAVILEIQRFADIAPTGLIHKTVCDVSIESFELPQVKIGDARHDYLTILSSSSSAASSSSLAWSSSS